MESEETDKGVWVTVAEGGSRKVVLAVRYDKPKGGGRKKVITADGAKVIETLASQGCILDDIASEMGIAKKTLYTEVNKAKVHDAYERGVAKRDNLLRRAQFQKAVKGNATMLIWLGKVWLGQREADAEASSDLANFAKAIQGVRGDTEEE